MTCDRDLSKSVFYMANHPILPRLFPAVCEVSKKSDKFIFVCDVAFAPIVRALNMETISVFSKNKVDWANDNFERFRVKLLRTVANKFGLDKTALKGHEVVDEMSRKLDSGYDVFMCPSGVSNINADWRIGAGAIAQEKIAKPVQPSFVYIPVEFTKRSDIKYFPTFGSLVPQAGVFQAKEVARQLQAQYNNYRNS